MKAVKLLPVLLVALFLFGQSEEAEAQVSIGPQVALWDFDELAVGGKLQYELGDTFGIEDGTFQDLYGAFDVQYLIDHPAGSPLNFNLNAGVPFDIDAGVTPFAGAGINYLRWSGEGMFGSVSSSGLNLLGGLEFDAGVPIFAQLAYSTGWAGVLTLSGGVMFGL